MNEVAATARQEGAMRHVFFAGKSSRAVNQVFKKRSVAGDVVSSFCFDPPLSRSVSTSLWIQPGWRE